MIDIPALVVRDGILVVAWLTAIYLVFTLLNLSQLGRQNGLQGREQSTSMTPAESTQAARMESTDAKTGARSLHVSPRYEVAVSLAFQGFDVASIARRCDISVAEAKLVATLAQSYQGLETNVEEPHGRPHRVRVAA